MTESKAITVVPQRQVTLEVVETAQTIAKMAGMFKLQPDQAAIAMLTGYELGLGLITSLRFVDVIQAGGRMQPALRAQAMEALINRSGVLDEFKVTDHADQNGNPTGCTVYMKRTINGLVKEYSSTFTHVDAERAELAGKSNWQHYPKDMYYNRALSRCARRVCADVILGLYTPDEITDGEWQIVEAEPTEIEKSSPQTPPKSEAGKEVPSQASDAPIETKKEEPAEEAPEPETSAQPDPQPEPPAEEEDDAAIMNKLVEEFGIPAIMEANNGMVPNGLEQWRAVRNRLREAKKDA